MKKNNKVVIGMSGGVDSSVAAVLLQRKGYEVIGVTLKLCVQDNEEAFNKTIGDAKKVCEKLNIEHHVIDFTKEFREHVVDNFTNMYKVCKTPNPCIECNRYLKFGAMFKVAQELGAYYIATGHYANVEYCEKYDRYAIKKINSSKDQSYFLYGISKEVMSHILFPLSEYEDKEEVRKIAEEVGLLVARKKDSQDICFIPDGDYIKYLEEKENVKMSCGNIVHINGKILGEHKGLHRYTIGQRKGIGVAYNEPIYVVGFNIEKNELIVGSEKDLEKKELYAEKINLVLVDNIEDGIEVKVKIRYNKSLENARLYNLVNEDENNNENEANNNKRIKVVLENPITRVTPGQSVVFYLDDFVLGGGIIQ